MSFNRELLSCRLFPSSESRRKRLDADSTTRRFSSTVQNFSGEKGNSQRSVFFAAIDAWERSTRRRIAVCLVLLECLRKLFPVLLLFLFLLPAALRTRGFYRKFRTLVGSEMDRAKRDEAYGLQRRTKESFKSILVYTGWNRKGRDKTYR